MQENGCGYGVSGVVLKKPRDYTNQKPENVVLLGLCDVRISCATLAVPENGLSKAYQHLLGGIQIDN